MVLALDRICLTKRYLSYNGFITWRSFFVTWKSQTKHALWDWQLVTCVPVTQPPLTRWPEISLCECHGLSNGTESCIGINVVTLTWLVCCPRTALAILSLSLSTDCYLWAISVMWTNRALDIHNRPCNHLSSFQPHPCNGNHTCTHGQTHWASCPHAGILEGEIATSERSLVDCLWKWPQAWSPADLMSDDNAMIVQPSLLLCLLL